MPKYLTARIQYALEQRIRISTSNRYKTANNHYHKFCDKYGIIPLPITEEKWLYYISDSLTTVKPSTIKTYISGIKYHSRINGYGVDTATMPIYQQLYKSLNTVFGANDAKIRKPFTFQ